MTEGSEFLERSWPLLQQADLYLPRPNPTFGNPSFAAAAQRILILRLSPFRDVDRSTPHLFLFHAARRALPQAYIDLAFFPPRHDRERLLQAVNDCPGFFLHSYALYLKHPATGEQLDLRAEPPEYFRDAAAALELPSPPGDPRALLPPEVKA